jgi:hypothetical protein
LGDIVASCTLIPVALTPMAPDLMLRKGEIVVPHVLAYVDPGSGSLLIQAAIATMVAIPFIVRRQIASVWNSVFRRSRDGDADPKADAPADAPH